MAGAGVAAGYGLDAYAVVRTLGSGDGCVTQLVVPRNETAFYVRKYLKRELANPAAWQTLAYVSHPLVPRVREQGWSDGDYAVVYDYVEGQSLKELIEQGGPLAERYAIAVLRDVASAAQALHEAGIVHRDISPGNVVIDSTGRAHLTDLGIARLTNEVGSCDTTRLGTWGFAPPEQYGFAQTDARSDVYAMGRLLAYACTATMPEVGSPELQYSALSAPVAAVVHKACAFEPSARYQSAVEFDAALAACEDNIPRETKLVQGAGAQNMLDQKPERGPWWLRACGWLLFVAWALGAFIFIVGSFGVFTTPEPVETPVASFLLGIAVGAMFAYYTLQTWRALKMQGIYAQKEGRIKKLLLRYLYAMLLTALVIVILIIAVGIVRQVWGTA